MSAWHLISFLTALTALLLFAFAWSAAATGNPAFGSTNADAIGHAGLFFLAGSVLAARMEQ